MENGVSVVDLQWERVLLSLDVVVQGDTDAHQSSSEPGEYRFFLSALDGSVSYPVDAVSTGVGVYRLTMNVTTFHGRSQIPNGEWRIVARREGQEATPEAAARIDLSGGARFGEWSRAFVYDEGRSAYTVTFNIADSEESPDFLIQSYAIESGRRGTSRRERTVGSARSLWARAKRSVLRGVFRVARRTSRSGGTRILFASDARPSLQGNLKAVHRRMIERGLDQQYEFDFFFRSVQTMSRASAFRLGWKMGRADIVLTDDYFPIIEDLLDPSSQKIIQLWHAGSGFKLVGYSRFGERGSPRLMDAHRRYTFVICGSEHLRDVYSEVFGIERESVIPTGLPRIDEFLREGREAEVRPVFDHAFPAAAGKRKILFAPTFRGADADDAHYDYDTLDFEALHAACGDDTVILFRQHHLVQDPAPIPEHLCDRLIDVTAFPDTNDLLLISDVLVTDYSSIIYEYALLRRPMVFYAYDLDIYSALRGMHRDYREVAPGEIAENCEQLIELISRPDLSVEKTEAFLAENFDHIDTNNSDRVIDQLILSDPRFPESE